MNVALGTGATRYIGQRVLRKEDPRLLTGRGQFVDDIALPGFCTFLSPAAASRADVSSALTRPQRAIGLASTPSSPGMT